MYRPLHKAQQQQGLRRQRGGGGAWGPLFCSDRNIIISCRRQILQSKLAPPPQYESCRCPTQYRSKTGDSFYFFYLHSPELSLFITTFYSFTYALIIACLHHKNVGKGGLDFSEGGMKNAHQENVDLKSIGTYIYNSHFISSFLKKYNI